MARISRHELPDGWFHVYNRGSDHRMVFEAARDKADFIDVLAAAVDRYDVEVHAYCVMGNHFHLLVRGSTAELSKFMNFATSRYARIHNSRRRADGPVFRGRYRSRPLRSWSHVAIVARYIHRNPLDVEDVSEFDLPTYPWSSYRAYINGEAPGFLRIDLIGRFLAA